MHRRQSARLGVSPRIQPFSLATLIAASVAALALRTAGATTVTIDWPEGAQGKYCIVGRTDWQSQDLRVELEDGRHRLIGPGFDTTFEVKGNVVTFEPPQGLELSLDRATNTLRFTAATITLELNGLSMGVQVPRLTGWLRGGQSHKLTLVCSRQHILDTVGAGVTFGVDRHGNVSLPDHPAGFTAEGSVLTVLPRAFAFEPGGDGQWRVENDTEGFQRGSAARNLVPTAWPKCYRLAWKPEKGPVVRTDFHVDRDFRLSLQRPRDGAEFLEIPIASPDGKGIHFVIRRADFDPAAWKARDAQRRAAAQKTSDFLASVLKHSTWQKEFVLTDFMQIYDFPEELVSYGVEFPAGKVRADNLVPVATHGEFLEQVEFQLGDPVSDGGFLRKATLYFRTDLPRGATRRFTLAGASSAALPRAGSRTAVIDKAGNEAVLAANLLRVRVPYGTMEFPDGKPLSETLAPILAVGRDDARDGWVGRGSFVAPANMKVSSLRAEPVMEGPLLGKYRIVYKLLGGRTYTVVLTVQHNEKHLTVDEYLERIRPEDNLQLKFDLVPGLDPDRREVQNNGGYAQYSGDFDAPAGGFLPRGTGATSKGKLPYELGLNTPNSYGIMRATTFYRDRGEHALLLALYRIRDWKTARPMVWGDTWGQSNLVFFGHEGQKYMLASLQGRQRHWALSLIPRRDVVHASITDSSHRAGPEVRLWQKLADFSLDHVKDMGFEWDEGLQRRLPDIGKEVSYDDWLRENGMSAQFRFLDCIVNAYWDYSSTAGPVSFRAMPRWFGDYDASRAKWTLPQRRHVRAILVWMAHCCEDDNNLPHHSMLAGHPNFIMDVKQTLPLACAVLPDHPRAHQWRDSFLRYYQQWLDTYQRDPDPKHNALGGRWTENIACYSGTSLAAVLHSHLALQSFDATDLLDHARIRSWVRWYLNAMMSPHEGVRLVPPEGAHARAFEPGNAHGYYDVLFEIADRMKGSAPELAGNMRWIRTGGKEGRSPQLKSVLIADYGPVLRHDFGGPHEAYVHLTQIAGRWNYRWGDGHSVLYYGAKDRIWSHNTTEEAGDAWNINNVTSFSVAGQGLGRRRTDQPFYDFGFAQFYRALGADGSKCLSRAMMLLRDDCLVLYDDVEGDVEGQFVWANVFALPVVQQLKPGVTCTEETFTEALVRRPGTPPARTSKIRRYVGKGDFLTVVSPTSIDARATAFGAVLRDGQHVFCSDKPIDYADAKSGVAFAGTYGYARANQLALFEGTKIGLGGLAIRREGGDFGISAEATPGRIAGRFAGRTGGRVVVTPDASFQAQGATVQVDGKPVVASIQDGRIGFDVTVSQADGCRGYVIFAGIASQESNDARPTNGRPEYRGFRFTPPDITNVNTNKPN